MSTEDKFEKEDDSDLSSDSSPPPKNASFFSSSTKLLDDGRFDCYTEDPLKVVKKIIKEGNGPSPSVGSKVIVHYVGTLLNGDKFDSSRDRSEPFNFKLGLGQVIKGWDIGVSSMKVGEVSDFEIQSDYAYGDRGSPPKIPPKSTLNFNIELISFEKEPVTVAEKIEFATTRKDEGNAFVKKQEWQDALKSYDQGLKYVRDLTTKNETLMKKKKELHEQLQANKALCCIKLDKVKEGVKACDEILRVDQSCTKAWYRRALLYKKQGDYLRAKSDLVQAAQLSPNDSAVRTELQSVNAYVKQLEQKEKKTYSNMFEKMKALEAEEALAKKKRAEAEAEAEEERKKKAAAAAAAAAAAEAEKAAAAAAAAAAAPVAAAATTTATETDTPSTPEATGGGAGAAETESAVVTAATENSGDGGSNN